MTSIVKPYVNHNRPENMTDYSKSIEDGYYIYGEPHITDENRSPICSDDVLLVPLDENGNKLNTKNPNYITPFGDKYQLNKKNEKIWKSKNDGKQYNLTLADGSTRLFRPHHLQLWSYYSDPDKIDWTDFCKNKDKNCKNGKCDAEVDHILQQHKRCHFKYLEAVPHSENVRRSNLSSNGKNGSKQSGITRGKPFHIWIDGNKIDRVFETLPIGIDYLKNEFGITISNRSIRKYIKSQDVIINNNRKLQFDYTEEYEYKETLKDLDSEIWYTPNQWKQKGEIENIYNDSSLNPPKSISNLGRLHDGKGKRTRGTQEKDKSNQEKDKNSSVFNGVSVHKLVWLSFSDEPIGDRKILHNKEDDSNKKDENGNCIRYSNAFNTLRLGTNLENNIEKGEDRQREKERDPMNEFIVKDKNGEEIMRSHYVPDCLKRLCEAYPNETFDDGNIRKCLNPDRYDKSHKGFTFTYVKARNMSSLK